MSGANTVMLLPRMSDKRAIAILRELHTAEECFVGVAVALTGGDGACHIALRKAAHCRGLYPISSGSSQLSQSLSSSVHDTSDNLRAQPAAEQNALYTIKLAI